MQKFIVKKKNLLKMKNNTLAKAMVIKADGSVVTHYFNGPMATLKEMQTLVNGLIEPIYLSASETMFINEEWTLWNKTVNKAANSFLLRNNKPGYQVGGDVFVINNNYYD